MWKNSEEDIANGWGVEEITGRRWNDKEEQIIKMSVLGTRMLRMAHAGYKEVGGHSATSTCPDLSSARKAQRLARIAPPAGHSCR